MAKAIDLVEYLSQLGYTPKRIRGNSYWYLSPFRAEKTASFKVNGKLNRWYDFGIGRGGNLIDFGILFYGCTVSELLQKLQAGEPVHKYYIRGAQADFLETEESRITILKETTLHSFDLCSYLHERKIDLQIADKYCREITFGIGNKEYNAIGFKNDLGGYELRNPWFKGSSSPKGMTTIRNGHYNVSVYEGFFDFLSYKTYFKILNRKDGDDVILNSLSFFDQALEFMEAHQTVFLHLDNDKAGQNCIDKARARSPKYHDARSLYQNYKDVNDWLVSKPPDRLYNPRSRRK